MSDESDLKVARRHPLTERMLRVNGKMPESGPRGNSQEYKLRHEFTFSLTDAQRAEVNQKMATGMTFTEAIHAVINEEKP
jgi:hypothetical protein